MTSEFKLALSIWVEETYRQACNAQHGRTDLEMLKIAQDRLLEVMEREPTLPWPENVDKKHSAGDTPE